MLLSSRGPSRRAESAQPADSPRRLPPARAPALCKILPGTELPAALEHQRVITPSASRSRVDGHRGRAPEATRNPERARAVKEATRPRWSGALSEGAPSGSQGLPASIHTPRALASSVSRALSSDLETNALALPASHNSILRKLVCSLSCGLPPPALDGYFPVSPLTRL